MISNYQTRARVTLIIRALQFLWSTLIGDYTSHFFSQMTSYLTKFGIFSFPFVSGVHMTGLIGNLFLENHFQTALSNVCHFPSHIDLNPMLPDRCRDQNPDLMTSFLDCQLYHRLKIFSITLIVATTHHCPRFETLLLQVSQGIRNENFFFF